jgi:DnaJ-class molecular chaperone
LPNCTFCHGEGFIDFGQTIRDRCNMCNGSGKFVWSICPECDGGGEWTESGHWHGCSRCHGWGLVGSSPNR